MTNEQINGLRVGDVVEVAFGTSHGKAVAGTRWAAHTIRKILYRGVSSVDGATYVGVLADWNGLEVSFGIRATDAFVRLGRRCEACGEVVAPEDVCGKAGATKL